MLQICNQIRYLFDEQLQIKFSHVNTLLGSGQYSIVQQLQREIQSPSANENKHKISSALVINKMSNVDALPKSFYVKFTHSFDIQRNLLNCSSNTNGFSSNLVVNLINRQMNSRLDSLHILQPEMFRSINIQKRIFGHLSAVYCVCFDRTGQYILTGADDSLIKAWSAGEGRLMATFRGHEKEISDIDVNYENTLLASGSCDKSIRIWNLKTTECTTVLNGHNNMVTCIEFSPICRGENRWLASSGNDGVVCFWQWNASTLTFNPKPKKFIEKSRPGSQMLCLSFSAGGSFLAAGSNDHAIRIYFFDNDNPIKICELEAHSNIVDSIMYANNSARFLSGSKDGTARIWCYENQKWKAMLIDASKTLQKPDNDEMTYMDIHRKYNVTMVTWNSDDSLVVTAQNNFLIKVWNSQNARLIHELKGHNDEVFVLEAHPRDPRLLLSAGHDGHIILWNIFTGRLIKKFYNKIDNEGHGCLFDTKWSPNMDMFASTDSHGNLSCFGFGSEDVFKRVPNEQFFHTDYRPLMRDPNGFVLDEQTQQPPHLMPPPFLVDADGNPYSAEYQRLVPGRENLSDAQLHPNVITHENGLAEIIGDTSDESENVNNNNYAARRRSLWVKDLIRPLDTQVLKTSEASRLTKLDLEEDYFITEYKKELHANEKLGKKSTDYVVNTYTETNNNENSKRRRGQQQRRATTSRGTMNESENENTSGAAMNDVYDEDTYDNENQYVDVDENSQHSAVNMAQNDHRGRNDAQQSSSTSASRAHQTTSTTRANDYIDPNELATDSESSEYSDWAAEDSRTNLRPPPRRTGRKTRRNRRTLRVNDEEDEHETINNRNRQDDDEEEVVTKSKKTRSSKTSISKKLKKIDSSDEDVYEQEDVEEEVERKRRKKVTNYNEDDFDEEMDDLNEEDEQDDDSDSEYSDFNDENVDPNKPCTSQAANMRSASSSKSPSKKRGRHPKHQSKQSHATTTSTSKSKKNKSRLDDSINMNECPPEYRPPEWLTSTKPKKSPYVPQIGDEVVYFKQGHELYVQAVKKNKVYDIDEKSLPWNSNANLEVQEYCRVTAIKIEIKPPRLVCLKLSRIDRQTGQQYNDQKISIKYHDMPHVVDFVILRQIYERGVSRHWRAKDRFRCIIDDFWWCGVIEEKKAFQEEHANSEFQCLKVTWDSGESEELSPWDLEPLSGVNARKTKPVLGSSMPSNGEPVTPDELKSLLYTPDSKDWPEEGRDSECERILNGLEKIMELALAEHFNYPVDLDSFPVYARIVDYPIDLNTIKERIENRYYRRLLAIQWDVRKIESNAILFNEPKSEIVRKASLLTGLLDEFINDPHCTNPMPIYKRICKEKKLPIGEDDTLLEAREENADVSELHNETLDAANRTTRSTARKFNLRSNQSTLLDTTSSRPTASTTAKLTWQEKSLKLVQDIMSLPESHPFCEPVDLSEYPDYLTVVDEPIDFGTIRTKLEENTYGNDFNSFDKDCRLLFANSLAYNTNKRSRIYHITHKLKSMYESKITEIMESYRAETSKYGRVRKTRTLLLNDSYETHPTASTSTSKHTSHTGKQAKSSHYETAIDELSPTTTNSTHARRKSNKLKSNSSHSVNENSQLEASVTDKSKVAQLDQVNEASNVFDRSFMDSVLEQDNVEYDLNNCIINDGQLEEENVNSTHQITDNQPTTSATSLNSIITSLNASTNNRNEKSRIRRNDSETVLSFNDALDNQHGVYVVGASENLDNSNENSRSSRTRKSTKGPIVIVKRSSTNKMKEKRVKDDGEDEDEEEQYEEDDEIVDTKRSSSKNKSKSAKKRKHDESDDDDDDYEEEEDEEERFDDEDEEEEEEEDDEDDDYAELSKKSSKRTSNQKSKSSKSSKVRGRSKAINKSSNDYPDNKENQQNENRKSSSSYKKEKTKKGKSSSSSANSRPSRNASKRLSYRELTSSSNEDNDANDDVNDENFNEESLSEGETASSSSKKLNANNKKRRRLINY